MTNQEALNKIVRINSKWGHFIALIKGLTKEKRLIPLCYYDYFSNSFAFNFSLISFSSMAHAEKITDEEKRFFIREYKKYRLHNENKRY